MTDGPARTQKKTEMIEVRVSYETKRNFLDACQHAGRTASEVIREAVDDYIVRSKSPAAEAAPQATPEGTNVTPMKRRVPGKRWLAAGGAFAALSVFSALPSAAQPDLAAAFRALDANGDGALSAEEFGARGAGGIKTQALVKVRQGELPVAADDDAPPVIFLLPPDAEAEARQKGVRYMRVGGVGGGAPAEARGASFADTDANKDARIDLAEFLARQKELLTNGFRRLDADANGGLDMAEYEALGRSFMIMPPGADPAMPMIDAKYGPLRSYQGLEAEFGKLDKDSNGRLSLEEYLPG